jgi:hypothetical protein
MPDGVVSNLGLTAGAGLYANTGLRANAVTAASTDGYRNIWMANLLYTINKAATDGGLGVSPTTLAGLQSIGANVTGNYCPSLGDAIPSNVSIATGNIGLTGLMLANANVYLGSGNYRVFAQAFQTVVGFVSVTNQVILSACRSDEYLGPTFTTMDDLISGDITNVTLATGPFGEDLDDTGDLLNFDPLDLLNTPAGLLKQLAEKGKGLTPAVTNALKAAGLDDKDIADLTTDNRQDLFNPDGITENEFDKLQKLAYPALCEVQNGALADALSILNVTTPNINALCEVLDPKKIFPRSYPALKLDDLLIYNDDGTVNGEVENVLNDGSLVPKGCNDLAKIVPPDQAVAIRAIQVALGKVNSITQIDGARLARLLT